MRWRKATDRPINVEAERAEVLAALASVDVVVIFDESTPYEIVKALQPDVLVKGADWAAGAIVGADIVEARGGRVVRIRSPRAIPRRSSSRRRGGRIQRSDPLTKRVDGNLPFSPRSPQQRNREEPASPVADARTLG